LADSPEQISQPAESSDAQPGNRSGKVLVVGLGNPGIEYQFTPHNAGFLAIDRIAGEHGAVVANRHCRALTATVRIASRDVILAKPETFMNLSGAAVQALVREYEIDPHRDLIVLYDDVEFPLGTLRIRERGSSAGHNGVESISGAVHSEEWIRVRIGVAPELQAAAESARRGRKDYVLTPLKKADLGLLDEGLERATKAVEVILAQGVGAAMNEFNRREPNGPPAHDKGSSGNT
jgi:peptidyl-tRNA hydrolase, PTH1 family